MLFKRKITETKAVEIYTVSLLKLLGAKWPEIYDLFKTANKNIEFENEETALLNIFFAVAAVETLSLKNHTDTDQANRLISIIENKASFMYPKEMRVYFKKCLEEFKKENGDLQLHYDVVSITLLDMLLKDKYQDIMNEIGGNFMGFITSINLMLAGLCEMWKAILSKYKIVNDK